MLNIGRAQSLFEIQKPTTQKDSNGAPFSVWALYASVYAEIENAEVSAAESQGTGARREMLTSATLVCRCHPSQLFTPAMRAVETKTGDVYTINAVRYDVRRTTAYLDVVSGASAGGVA